MCGRYFWNDDAEEAFEDDFPDLADEAHKLRTGDYTPAMQALAVTGAEAASAWMKDGAGEVQTAAPNMTASGGITGTQAEMRHKIRHIAPLAAEILQWGFLGFEKGRLLINARAESVLTRPTFSESFRSRRCVIPAAGFYEWDSKKEKVIFTLPDKPVLYLAGIFRPYGPEKRFVILTREANASMLPVHDRMPLILTSEEAALWVKDVSEAESILTKVLPQLRAERPYEQLTFDW